MTTLLRRRHFLAGSAAAAALGGMSHRAMAKHKPWHRIIIGTVAQYLAQLDSLKTGDRAELEFVTTGSDEETYARIKAQPGQYDFAYFCSDTGPNLAEAKLAQPIAVGKLANWSNVYPALRSAPSVAESNGKAISIPTDWSFIAAVANTSDGAKLIPTDRLFADYKKIAFRSDTQSVMFAAKALGTVDPYTAS